MKDRYQGEMPYTAPVVEFLKLLHRVHRQNVCTGIDGKKNMVQQYCVTF